VERPKPVKLIDTKIYVVNKDNYDIFVKDFQERNGELAYVALAIKDYENLAINIAEIRRYLNQQDEIIVYYETAISEASETEPNQNNSQNTTE
jgi:hypothetical protein